MSYDAWKLATPPYYETEDDYEERLEWDDMEPIDEDDDEFFAGWLDAKLVSPEPCP